jgi:putative ABC transport system permease protein
MIFFYTFKTAVNALASHKTRSVLTILGIVIGITAIMLVMSLGGSAKDLILSQIQGLGSQTIFVEPGREPKGPADFTEIFTDSLKPRDVTALLNPANVQGISAMAPSVIQATSISSEDETVRMSIMGTDASIAEILDLYAEKGVFFGSEDVKQRSSVAVLGSEAKDKLFGKKSAIGEKIKIKGKPFRVVATLPPKGQVGFVDVDHLIAIPYTTAQEYIMGISYFNVIMMRAESENAVSRVAKEVELTLREQHGITDPDKDDFHVMTQVNTAERVGTVTDILTILLASVAAISLLVGGIGIMNIMLVSVTERTPEIGLRKALGATDQNVMIQFLCEAVLLTLIGGVIGILIGTFLSFLTSFVLSRFVGLDWGFTFPVSATALGLLVSSVVGLVFGLYPAQQAARKHPIEALRYE